jgi:WD40 repeat protein
MLSSAWSPDNEYLITGGEDDLVVVWSATDKCPVARFRVYGLGFRV